MGRQEGQDSPKIVLPIGRDLPSVTSALVAKASRPKSVSCMFPF